MGVSINYMTNFKRLNRLLFVGGEVDGRATIRVSETDTRKVLEELRHCNAIDAIRLHGEIFSVLADGEAVLDRLAGE